MGTASLTINVCRVAVVAVVAVLGGCQEGRAPLAPLGTPVLAHNSDRNEYLVVWWGEDPGAGVVDEEFEVFGQRLSAAGEETGADDFRISIMGAAGDPAYAALVPAVAAGDGEYLVAWWGDTGEPPLEDNEAEVYVRPIPAGGLGEPRRGLRVSRMGPDGEYLFAAVDPAVAFNTRDEEYVVVWLADEPGRRWPTTTSSSSCAGSADRAASQTSVLPVRLRVQLRRRARDQGRGGVRRLRGAPAPGGWLERTRSR